MGQDEITRIFLMVLIPFAFVVFLVPLFISLIRWYKTTKTRNEKMHMLKWEGSLLNPCKAYIPPRNIGLV